MTTSTKIIKIEAYTAPDGKPTCSLDFPAGKCCLFLGAKSFGLGLVCLVKPDALISSRPVQLGWLTPHKDCIVWHLEDAT
jgi:hypothetical protein